MKDNEYLETISLEKTATSSLNQAGTVKSTRIFLRDLTQCLENIYDYENDEYYDVLLTLVDGFVNATRINADADDFHNISVQLSRRDEYSLATRILEVGLKNYPWNPDLLADYIQDGCSICKSQKEESDVDYDNIQRAVKDCYKKLIKISRNRWTWRAYSFTIDYLSDFLQDKERPDKAEAFLEKAYVLAEEFVNNYASDESYVSLSEVVEKKQGIRAGMEILEKALEEKLKNAPKCAMRYAEKLFSNGSFEEALKIAQRGIKDGAQTQQKVNLGYLYLLSGLSRISLLESKKQDNSLNINNYPEGEVIAVFCDFNIAVRELGKRSEYRGIIVSQTNALIDKTSIKIPEDKYFELNSLLQEN